jgi:acetyl-CoA synthetase
MPEGGLLRIGGSYEVMRASFAWPQCPRFNITAAACTTWARTVPGRVALRALRPDGGVRDFTYGQLERASSRFGEALKAHGIGRGDRVAILLPQTPEAAITHLAVYRIGAVVVPLFTLFGAEGLAFRLKQSGASAAVTDAAHLPKLLALRDACPDLGPVFCTDAREAGVLGFWQELGRSAEGPPPLATSAADPALIAYTSGTTGPPKGVLHAHRVLLGHLPGIEMAHEGLGLPGDCLWTPADWAWLGGLTNLLLPGLARGVTVVAHRMAKFDPDRAAALMRDLGVRNVFLPPTALKLMRQHGAAAAMPKLRSVTCAGEALGAEMLDWGERVFGRTINEFYGQTECNAVVSNCAAVMPARPGSTGRAVPGHEVAVIDGDGRPLPPGMAGEIAIRRPDPVMFLRYWRRPEATAERFLGDWLRTGDEGTMDEQGYLFFGARSDDVITSSGYRIGPAEIEDCLAGDPAVAMAAVVGVRDPIRTQAVRAFVVTVPGAGREGLADALVTRVRTRLSPHMAPREIVFVESLPMTATGKIQRRELRTAAEAAESLPKPPPV